MLICHSFLYHHTFSYLESDFVFMELKQNKLKNNVIFPCKKPFLFLSGVDMLGMFPYQECLRMCKRKRK